MKAIITKTVETDMSGINRQEILKTKIVVRLFGIPLYKSLRVNDFR